MKLWGFDIIMTVGANKSCGRPKNLKEELDPLLRMHPSEVVKAGHQNSEYESKKMKTMPFYSIYQLLTPADN